MLYMRVERWMRGGRKGGREVMICGVGGWVGAWWSREKGEMF